MTHPQPPAGNWEPPAGDSQPPAGDSQPPAGNGQPPAGNQQPSAGGQPLAGNQRPPVGSWQPAAHGQSWQPAGTPPGVPAQQPWMPRQAPAQQPAPGQQQAPSQQPWMPQPPQQWGPPGVPGPNPPGPGAYQSAPGQYPPGWPAAKPSALPVEPREYHEFLRTPRMRWWRPVLALLMGAGLFLVANLLFTVPAMFYDMSTGLTTIDNYTSLDAIVVTPAFFLANNLSLAACIPIAGLTQWACFGQRPRWMSSVAGGFRWRWFGECVVWILPLFLASLLLDVVLGGLPEVQPNPNTVFMIATILVTTPLQSAGEEYLLRGLGQRAIAAWLPRTVGFAVSTAGTAVVFMLLHGAGDPWLNAFYLVFAAAASVLVWRTGGLEAAVALHAVNNVVSMTFLPFTDFSDMFDRGSGAGSPAVLAQAVILLGAVAIVLWRAKVRGVVVRSAPGAAAPVPGGLWVPPGGPGAPASAGPGVPASGSPSDQPPASSMPSTWRQDHDNQGR